MTCQRGKGVLLPPPPTTTTDEPDFVPLEEDQLDVLERDELDPGDPELDDPEPGTRPT